MANKEKHKVTIKDLMKAKGGYQPEPLIGDHEQIIPPKTGSNVKVSEKSESFAGYINVCTTCGLKFVDSKLRIFPLCPKCAESAKKRRNDSLLPQIEAQSLESPWGEDTPTQGKIKETLNGMTDLLLYKNQKYGDSALKPLGIFTKHIKNSNESTASILVRLDDKLSRVKNADSLRTNDVADILGYCTLLLISMGVTKEDLEKFMD